MQALIEHLDTLVEEDAASGKFRVGREAFTDTMLFELEMKYIFEANWIYMCHESQVAKPNDYLTGYIGRQPVIINRNKQGQLGGFINSCSHRGAMLCRDKKGNKAVFACSFHGWCYNSSGDLIKIRDEDGAGYPRNLDKKSLGLARVPRVAAYGGFVFASLNPDVGPIEEYLGEAKIFIDMINDQAPNGLEVLRGSSSYVYHGNWKLQAENGADGYHVGTVHWNYVATAMRRKSGLSADEVKEMDAGSLGKLPGGFYAFDNGHIILWSDWANPQDRPNYAHFAEYKSRHGEERANWMVGRLRNLCLYPNVFLMDQMSSQIRHFRPISVDRTEVTTYCFAPVGESAKDRAHRIRQYEDFFNASGMATPDDLAEFQSSQQGYSGRLAQWNDLSRGAAHWMNGSDDMAQRTGFSPRLSGAKIEDEGLFVMQHKAWKERLKAGLQRQGSGHA